MKNALSHGLTLGGMETPTSTAANHQDVSSVWANERHAVGISNPMTPGHIDDPCARNVSL